MRTLHKILTFLIAMLWLVNGLLCKVLNLVPRHQLIVGRIIGANHSRPFTVLVGILETAMALWVVGSVKPGWSVIMQIGLIAIMNTLEFFLAPDLLLWGRYNAIFAVLLILVIYYNGFHQSKEHLNRRSSFSFLKDHPFAVEAYFESSIVLTFAIPKKKIAHLIPECLQLDTFNDKWAFIAIAMVQTKDLRPKGFPKILGNDFFLVGYRVFVKYSAPSGKRLRGLYILKSETDNAKMKWMGNIFTHYNYSITDIEQTNWDTGKQIRSAKSAFTIKINMDYSEPILPENSPFADWKEARKFTGPLPFTFTYDEHTNEVLIIEGVRQKWFPRPVKVIDYDIPFFNSLDIKSPVLANAFIVENIPYCWKKGKKEIWKRNENPSRAC